MSRKCCDPGRADEGCCLWLPCCVCVVPLDPTRRLNDLSTTSTTPVSPRSLPHPAVDPNPVVCACARACTEHGESRPTAAASDASVVPRTLRSTDRVASECSSAGAQERACWLVDRGEPARLRLTRHDAGAAVTLDEVCEPRGQ